MTKPYEFNFKTTAEIKVPENLVEQIIGQDEAVNIVKKAAKQRRNVLLIGSPGTGKSLLGQGLATLLGKEKLVDVLAYPNLQDENVPLIKVVPKGKGRDLVAKARIQAATSFKNQSTIIIVIALISSIIPYFLWKTGKISDIIYAASMITSIIFIIGLIIFLNLGKRIKSTSVVIPKLLIDNAEKSQAPFTDACLLPGQRIFANPHPVKIEDSHGSKVYNAKGKKQKVVKVDRIPWKGKIYHIKPRLLPSFTATQNHPFLVLEKPNTKQFKLREFNRISKNINSYIKWKKAEELTTKDLLIYPEITHPKTYKILLIKENSLVHPIPNKILVDEEIGEIFGWYLAEGYARIVPNKRKYYLGFTFGFDEMKQILRLKSLIEKHFNLKSYINTNPGRSIELLTYSKPLTLLFKELFGLSTKNKKIPEVLFESPKKVKLNFLEAYFEGDSWKTKNTIAVATTSKNIAEELVFFFSGLGIFPTYNERKMKSSKINGRVIKGTYIYEFYITGKQLKKFDNTKGDFQHYFSKDNLHFIPIRKIHSEGYQGDIINMETEDGTYLMPCITHNTGSHAGALLGDCLHDPLQSGGLGTPAHERLITGAIHRSNGGVLYIDEIGTLDPHSQQELLTAMQEKKYSITGQSERSSGSMVKSESLPTDFILIAAGNYETIKRMHPALRSRIRGYGYEVYVNDTMPDTPQNRFKIAQFVAQEVKKDKKIPHFTKEAVEVIITEARKRAGIAGKLTLRLRELGGLVRAAGDLALEQGFKYVLPTHVNKAKFLARTLEQQIADKFIENKKKYEVILTEGKLVGRVNGLAVLGSENHFSGIVLPIESEVTPGGKKSEIVATGQLGKIAKEAVKNVSAIILKHFGEDIKEKYDIYTQFLYTASSGVEGDSASIAVATSIISALTKVPVKQDFSMTGSLSVRGNVLAVGGVTQKIEAAIEAGIKNVLVPKSNFQDVMLSKEQLKRIKIYPVATIEEVLKLALEWKGKEEIYKKFTKKI